MNEKNVTLEKKFQKFIKQVEDEKIYIELEKKKLEEEKGKMKKIGIEENDIIYLNIGGKKINCKRSTLCQFKGTFLEAMFSGRWEDKMEKDKEGNIFLDFNPYLFQKIIDFLRAKRIEEKSDKPIPIPNINKDQKKEFYNLVNYLGLENIMKKDKFSKKLIYNNISLNADCTIATHNYNSGHGFVFGKKTYISGVVNFSLKIEYLQNNNWMFLGIISLVTLNQNSYNQKTSFGWSRSNLVYIDGQDGYVDYIDFISGDLVNLILDCDNKKLSLKLLRINKEYFLTLPYSGPWRLHINLYGSNDSIRIIEVT
jgi:hypothetical protein